MRNVKNLLVIILLVVFAALLTSYNRLKPDSSFVELLAIAMILVFLFNLVARNFPFFEPYFVSKWNLFISSTSRSIRTQIPEGLVLDKLKEVLEENKFKVKSMDAAAMKLLATTGITWKSWGENIYITVVRSGNEVTITFTSVALFQLYTWGKHDDNFNRFYTSFEESLTI